MKPKPLTAKRKQELARAAALDAHVANLTTDPDPRSLAKSYNVEMEEVIRILKMRGRYHG